MSEGSARRVVILTEGSSEPIAAKTAASVIRYGTSEVVALLDSTQVGNTAQHLLGVGGSIPVVGSLQDVEDVDTLLVGVAPPGGKIPNTWRVVLRQAVDRSMNIVSGLHDFLTDDEELVALARERKVELIDLRKNDEHDVATGVPLNDSCLRIHTVGNDCCVGKMVVAIEVAEALKQREIDAQFIATGQTGIMIAGSGCPVDCVVSDFVSGAAEKLMMRSQHHEVILIEGQGSLAHPRYSAVTLGLLHGVRPQGLIMCYEVGRTHVGGMPEFPLCSLKELVDVYEWAAGLISPARVIGVAMNSRTVSAREAEQERGRVREELGLPVCDVFRNGPDDLVNAVINMRAETMS